MAIYFEVWMERFGTIMVRFGKIWKGVVRYGKVWQVVGVGALEDAPRQGAGK